MPIDFSEVKNLIQEQGEAFTEFKKTNDELLKAKAEGKAVSDMDAKLALITVDLEAKADKLDALQNAIIAATSPGAGSKADESLSAEVKGFNLMVRAEFQSKGKPIPAELDVDGYKQYKSGFFSLVSGTPFDQLSIDERKALSAGSDPDGGYLLPHSTVGLTVSKLYEQSIMRQIANVVVVGTNDIEGIIDNDEADAGWVSELGSRADSGTPQVGKYRIEAHEMYAMPKISQKLIDDASTNVEGWLAGKVADKFARVEGTAFWAGTGVGQPRGLASYTTAATGDGTRAWGTFEHVKTGAAGDFHTTKLDPMQDLIGAFKDQYLQNGIIVARREVRTKILKLKEATSDRYLWEPSSQVGQPARLNGYDFRVDQYMPALTTDSLSLAMGDFRQAYTIIDRIGIRVLRDPFTAKPYIVFYTTKRTGGGATNFEAVKFLKFSS
jgi:HK97 family phage major capsid protein